MTQNYKYVFFGTGALAESVLAELCRSGYVPSLLVTKKDTKQGRHMILTEPNIKKWANMKGLSVLQPEKLDENFLESLSKNKYDFFIVASYGKIIPESILNLPTHGVLNVHPSLLPLYRGPSPIESVLLDGVKITGVTIMKLDKEMDHGPIISQTAFNINPNSNTGTLEVECGQMGGKLLVDSLEHYLNGNLIPKEQEHSKATFCKKITKELGEINLFDDIEEVKRKFRALNPWPMLYFFIKHKEKNIRVKINQIDLISIKESTKAEDYIITVTPEGKKEMDFESFKRGYLS